jgi:hypothetical protein
MPRRAERTKCPLRPRLSPVERNTWEWIPYGVRPEWHLPVLSFLSTKLTRRCSRVAPLINSAADVSCVPSVVASNSGRAGGSKGNPSATNSRSPTAAVAAVAAGACTCGLRVRVRSLGEASCSGPPKVLFCNFPVLPFSVFCNLFVGRAELGSGSRT